MTLDNDEMMVLNSMLDGKEIHGFYGRSLQETTPEYKKLLCGRLMKRGKRELDVLLKILNCYKHADNYIILNGNWTAIGKDCDISLVHVETGYEVVVWDKGQFAETVYQKTKLFNHDGIETKKAYIPVNTKELIREIEEKGTNYSILMNCRKNKMEKYYILYELEGIRYCLDVFCGCKKQVSNTEIREMLRKCEE